MSSMRYSKSFRNVPRPDFRVAPLDSHQFLYDVHDLHTLHGRFDYLTEMGGVQGLAVSLRTDIKDGLYKDEVEVANDTFKRRTEIYGANIYVRPPLKTFLEFCLEAVSDPMLIILSIAGVISVGLGIWESPSDGWYEGISIVIAVVLVTSISAGNNYKQQLEFAKLDRDNSFDDVTVIRGGQVKRIPQMDILVGDVIQLAAGGFIPADGVLIADEEIKVNESRMTGESRDVEKNFYSPFLFAGTEVRQGQAMMLATAVGSESAFGRILAALASEQSETPLQEKLNEAAEFIGKFGAGVGLVLFITLFIRWMVQDVSKGTEDVTIMTSNVTSITESQSIGWHAPTKNDWNTFIYYFIMAITIIVVAVPEGLPLAVTVSLAYSMSRMRADQIMVHVLSAAETMGNVTTICSDKTGTLTQNLMTVVRTYLGGKFSEQRPTKEQIIESPIVRQLLIESIAINSKAWCEEKDIEKGKPAESWPWKEGNQTEISLLAWISSYDINVSAERNAIPVEKSHPFDSIKKYSTVVLRSSLNEEQVLEYEGDLRQYFKGAAERIVQSCTRQVDWKGRVTPLDAPAKEQVLAAIDSMTRSGLRTIAFSYVDHQENDVPTNDDGVLSEPPARNDCVLIGVAGIQDPLRPETYGAVRKCQKAGIVVRMVTGDHLETAKSIAKECGILTSDKHVAMLGEQFRKLVEAGREEELLDLLPRLRVLARSSPEDKEALVKWYGAHGHVVAVTGDGTNDAPALKAADVGLAMYLNGTAVARAAAQVWIMDDNFSSIVKSVVWGRAVFDNIRKFVQFQLTINVVALMLSLIGAFSGYENPLGAVQLLWVNLIMDTFAALALGTELPNEALLDRKPYTRDSFLISPAMFRNILTMSVYQLFVLLLLLYGADKFFTIGDGLGSTEHYTILFNCFVLMQFANEINCRKCNREMNVFENLLANHAFNIIMVFSIGVQAILVEFGGGFAKTTGLTGSQWAGCLVIGVSPLVAGAIFRLIPADAYKGQIDVEESVFDGAHLTDMRYDERRMTKAASFLQQQPLKAENDREEDRQEQHPHADNDKETERREAEQRKQNQKEIDAVERIQTGLGLETEKEEKESTEKPQDS